MNQPLALDLYCGRGGWARGLIAAGWLVVGVDIEDYSKDYPGQFVQADIRKWDMWRVMPIRLVVASAPCEEFSRWSMPWLRRRMPPVPDMSLIWRAYYIMVQLGCPGVLENVRGAQSFLGRSAGNCGPFHLWWDVPAILPVSVSKPKSRRWGSERSKRAEVDFHLAYHVGKYFLTAEEQRVPGCAETARCPDTSRSIFCPVTNN